ncbi:DUF4375 domain-containing protein [Bartonella sp. HY038]|uniref:DMP19 family protein n=1 Tax=Bartonella sp. HY038 TaxID=2759660 RepID=UPI0015FAED62|nr:DUF4375 domain-containing protein [Bartonella sp. HY038]
MNFDETIRIIFHDLEHELFTAYLAAYRSFDRSKASLNNYKRLSDAFFKRPVYEQDLYWLYCIASHHSIIDYFQSLASDFAPYTHQALIRLNMPEIADIFYKMMQVFGSRYSGFNHRNRNLIGFSQEDSDNLLITGSEEMTNDVIEEEIRKAVTPSVLQAFPCSQQLYHAMRYYICVSAEARNWYEKRVEIISDKQRAICLVQNLFSFEENLGDWQNWPPPYRSLYLIEIFYTEIVHGSLGQYIYNQKGETVLALYNALRQNGLDELAKFIGDAKELYEQSLQKISRFYVERDKDKIIYFHDIMKTAPFCNFAKEVNIHDLLDKLDDAMTVIARNHNILPR